MGINAIGCEGDALYAAKAKRGIGDTHASDFSLTPARLAYAVLAAAVVGISGCINQENDRSTPSPDKAYVNKADDFQTAGRIVTENDNYCRIATLPEEKLQPGELIVMYPVSGDKDGPPNNVCRVWMEEGYFSNRAFIVETCSKPPPSDGLEIGQNIVIYPVREP